MEGNVVSELVRLLSLRIDYWVLSCFSPQSLRWQRGYIVTQLPLEDTVSDFWRMVDDWGVKVIVRFMDSPKEQVILTKCGFATLWIFARSSWVCNHVGWAFWLMFTESLSCVHCIFDLHSCPTLLIEFFDLCSIPHLSNSLRHVNGVVRVSSWLFEKWMQHYITLLTSLLTVVIWETVGLFLDFVQYFSLSYLCARCVCP